MRRIPYGETDYVTIRKENSYYVDKTAYIPYIENAAKYVIFLRPRRFGKSLFLNMLEAYYDVLRKDDYEQNFGGINIFNNTTPKQGQYMIMKFNFSAVDSNPERVQASFNSKTCRSIEMFVDKYKEFLPANINDLMANAKGKCDDMLDVIVSSTKNSFFQNLF
ncbi:MAG: AAA family ATPase [Bacteroidales bacterium]|nr:AAA family ATPase [Bacteroidales bacterium]